MPVLPPTDAPSPSAFAPNVAPVSAGVASEDNTARATPPPGGGRTLRLCLGFAVSVACAGAFIWGIDWRDLARLLVACHAGPLVAAVGLNVLQMLVRGLRWQVLLAPYGISFRRALAGVLLATAANNVLPARAGEVLRVTWLAEDTHQPVAPLLVTVIVERLFDLLAVAGLALWAAAWAARRGGGGAFAWGTAAAGLGLVAVAILAILLAAAWTGRRGALGGGRWIPARWRETADRLMRQVSGAVLQDIRPDCLLRAAALTVVLWAVAGASVGMGLQALGVEVGVAGWFLVLTAILAGIAVPSAPGFVGTYHLSCMLALQWLGVPRGGSAAAGILLHGISFSVTTAWGGLVALNLARRAGRP